VQTGLCELSQFFKPNHRNFSSFLKRAMLDAQPVPPLPQKTLQVTKQTRRDLIEGDKRMNNCGDRYAEMEMLLAPYSKPSLLSAAESRCEEMGIKAPDRICFRGRKPLICFFCQHFPDFPRGFNLPPDAAMIRGTTRDVGIPGTIKKRNRTGSRTLTFVGLLQARPDDFLKLNFVLDEEDDFLDSWVTGK
jgi:hypothetical protein